MTSLPRTELNTPWKLQKRQLEERLEKGMRRLHYVHILFDF